MKLAGQANRAASDRGYAMAVLLVAMSMMAIMMTVAMPVWKQTAQREKEEELVFRGNQYVTALKLFSRKYANAKPPNLDVLVEQRFLRKKFKDPITQQDFQPVMESQATAQGGPQGSAPAGGRSGQPQAPGAGGAPQPQPSGPLGAGRVTSSIGTPVAGATGGVAGVVSKSKDKSIRLYNGRGHYNEWAFMYIPQQQPGGGAPGAGVPGQRGGPQGPGGQGIGGRGRGNQGPPDGRGRGPGGPGFPGAPGQPQRGPGPSPFGGPSPFAPPPGRGRS